MVLIPHDLEAEKAVIGDMLQFPDVISEAADHLMAEDFYSPANAEAFLQIVIAWKRGDLLDAISLADAMREAGRSPDPHWLAEIASKVSAGWRNHADTVIRHRVRRDILAILTQVQKELQAPGADPLDVIDMCRARLEMIHIPTGQLPSDFYDLDEFADRPENETSPWVVPGLLRKGWRCVVVGTEGGGKSLLFRQFAVAAAQGLHPLQFSRIEPVRTMLIDLENPADAISSSHRHLRRAASRHQDYERGHTFLWHRPSGFDLRKRSTRTELERILSSSKPDLVTIGPLYKAHQRKDRESDEQIAAELMEIFDDLRTRHGFALLLEHHAPQMDTYGHRKLRPYGSSLWLRWPELGLAMEPDEGGVRLERWRGDRMSNSWPNRLARGTDWPWVAA